MYVPVSFYLFLVVALLVSACGLHRFQPSLICHEFILPSPLEGNREKLNLLRGGYFVFLSEGGF